MKNAASIALSCPQNRTTRREASYERLWFGKSIMSARSFWPIGDNPDRDQNAPRLKQARRGCNDLLPQPFEKIELRGHPACDAAADIQHIHGLTSLTSPD